MTKTIDQIKGLPYFTLAFYLKFFPWIKWLPAYRLNTLRGDIIAGVTVGLLIIPQGIAYATLAGLPAEYGLYTALTPGIIYCIFGTSKDVSVGPTVTMALFTYRFNSTHSPIGGSALAFCVGCVLLAMTLLKLGFITKFMPMHVNSGFVSAAAIFTAVSQIKNLLGLSSAPASFVGKLKHFVTNVKYTNQWDLMLGGSCIAFLLLFMWLSNGPLKKLQAKEGFFWKTFSNTLWFMCIARSGIVCIIGTIISYVVYTGGHGKLFSLAGTLPTGLPAVVSPFTTVHLPDNTTMTTMDFIQEFGSALIILPVIQFIQAISIAKAFGKVYNYEIDPTQELLALSLSNIFGSFFGGWPVTGSFSGSAVNAMSGTMTPASSIVACAIVFLAVGFLMPLFYYIPKTVLGAMISMAVITMIDYKTPMRIWKVRKLDLLPFAVAFFGTFYRLEVGVLAGAVVSLLLMVSFEVNPEHDMVVSNNDQTVTITFKGNLSYPSIECIKETVYGQLKKHESIDSVNIDMSCVYNIDYAVVNSLRSLIFEMENMGISIDFINFIDENIEESFKRGKLERKLAIEKIQVYKENKEFCDDKGQPDVNFQEDNIYHLHEMDGDVKIKTVVIEMDTNTKNTF